jgi:metallo-beta-lactamase family protein
VLTLTSLGGAGTVTGSKHLLESGGRRLLIDCGLFQGPRRLRELNWASLSVDPSTIECVILTHAHLDHSGYLPKLVKDGFDGPIYATPATVDVARLILLDSAHLQEKDAEFANRHGFSRHKPALPLYTTEDAERALGQFNPVEFHRPFDLEHGASLYFRRAGHILGAATVEVRLGGETIVFSGDLGRYDDATMVDPEPVQHADYVVVESTYGNRLHAKADPETVLEDVIGRTVKRGGTVVIPSFAVGRAQSLLYHLSMLRKRGLLDLLPVFIDSPMAINATELLCAHLDDHRMSPKVCGEACNIATYVRATEDSKALSASPVPKVIISASGMASGGRVLHHIKAFGRDPRNTILFSGFQAVGTLGRMLVEGSRNVKIHGDWIDIRAEIADLPMLSAHADADEIVRWLGGFESPPKKTFVVHGEPDAALALRDRIEGELGWNSTVPEMNESRPLSQAMQPERNSPVRG